MTDVQQFLTTVFLNFLVVCFLYTWVCWCWSSCGLNNLKPNDNIIQTFCLDNVRHIQSLVHPQHCGPVFKVKCIAVNKRIRMLVQTQISCLCLITFMLNYGGCAFGSLWCTCLSYTNTIAQKLLNEFLWKNKNSGLHPLRTSRSTSWLIRWKLTKTLITQKLWHLHLLCTVGVCEMHNLKYVTFDLWPPL